MDATSRLLVLYHGAGDPPVLTELPKTTWCTEIELWLFTDEVVSFPSLLSGLTKSFGL